MGSSGMDRSFNDWRSLLESGLHLLVTWFNFLDLERRKSVPDETQIAKFVSEQLVVVNGGIITEEELKELVKTAIKRWEIWKTQQNCNHN